MLLFYVDLPSSANLPLEDGQQADFSFPKIIGVLQFFKEGPRASCSLRTSAIQHAVYAAKHRLEMDTVVILVWSRSKQRMKQKH